MAHEIVQYHNDFNTVPLRGFNEREKRIVMALLHEVKGKDTQIVQLDFHTLRGWFCCKVFQKIYFSVKLRKKTERTE
ncbi:MULTISPECIES: RepB family plasmid replication initiator protein [Lactococcus]|nr:RepB family plasmid replication initiator protein [Lactococcus cremoris]KZK44597.1 Replication protein Rep [Lactococcus cremoris]